MILCGEKLSMKNDKKNKNSREMTIAKKDIFYNKETKELYMQHLEFIQNVINRQNVNSFQIKTFAITIFSAITALYISSQIISLYFISFIVTVMFWWLDAIYLLQERQYRNLFDDVVKNKIEIYSMDISKYKNNICDYIKAMFSKTIVPLYIVLIVLQLTIIIVKYNNLLKFSYFK